MTEPRPLPPEAEHLCRLLDVPDRLHRHLRLVHDVGGEMVNVLTKAFEPLDLDGPAVLLGCAVHDMGKVLHPGELIGSGRRHEIDGPALLERHGIRPDIARYARTHGTWQDEPAALEDLLVALADNLWRGRRLEALEQRLVEELALRTGRERWLVFTDFDTYCERLAAGSEERLRWQAGH